LRTLARRSGADLRERRVEVGVDLIFRDPAGYDLGAHGREMLIEFPRPW
jgi:hypothetical protein